MGVLLAAVFIGSSPAAATAATRAIDQAPFSGGDRLWTWQSYPYYQQCSGGFEMADYTYNYGMTAGHCPADISGVGTGYYTGDPSTTYYYWGAIAHYTTSSLDISVAPVSSALGVVWGGSPERFVYNWETTAQDAVGLHVCVDGATTGETCGATDTAINIGTKHLVESRCPGSTHCAQGGDSGGPVYATFPSGEVEAVGTIVNEIEVTSGGVHLYWATQWEPVRYIMSWVWTFNSHTNILCDICTPEP